MEPQGSAEKAAPKRVVEFELRLPRPEEIKLPKVDWEPWRKVAEEAIITGLGVGILVARGIKRAVEVAHEAGTQAAERPGTLPHTVVQWMRPRQSAPAAPSGKIRILPIEDYDTLSVTEIIERLPSLSAEQLRTVRAYEEEHAGRLAILKAIEGLLAAS